MIIGYAFQVGDSVFKDEGCDRVIIDVDSRRVGLTDLLSGALRLDPGDTIKVPRANHLGKGPALKRVRDFLDEKRVKLVEVLDAVPAKPKDQARGIPYEQALYAQGYYHMPGMTIDGVNEQLFLEGQRRKQTGWGPYARHQYGYALGNMKDAPRTLTPPTDAPLEDAE